MIRSLEEDILTVFYTAWQPLSILDVWDRLSDQGICVPVQYLAKVINTLVQTDYLRKAEGSSGLELYEPSRFMDRFVPNILKSVVRSAVKQKQAPKIHKFIATLGVMLFCMATAQAQQTIFNVPSADITPNKTIYLEHESQFRPWAPGRYWVGTHYFGYGIGHNTELDMTLYNVSSPPSDNIALGVGFKSALPLFPKQLPNEEFKLTGGSQILTSLEGNGVGNWSYAHFSGRVPKLKTRLTAGVSVGTKQLFGRNAVAFIGGVEQPVTKRLTLIADWYSGKHTLGFFTPGFAYALPKDFTLFAGYQIPNRREISGGQGFTIELSKLIP